jgi:hypothetical protein
VGGKTSVMGPTEYSVRWEVSLQGAEGVGGVLEAAKPSVVPSCEVAIALQPWSDDNRRA